MVTVRTSSGAVGLLVAFVASLVLIFVGVLEGVLLAGLYWLLSADASRA